MLPEKTGCRIKDAVVVIVIPHGEKHMPEVLNRGADEARDPAALIDAVLVGSLRIEASSMAQIARDNQNVALRQAAAVFLGLKVQIAHVMAAHVQSPVGELYGVWIGRFGKSVKGC